MPSNLYQLLALAARALFLFLAALLILRAAFSLLGQHRARKKLLRQLPDAGMVGEMRDIDSDKSYPLPREGVLGSGKGCDIRLPGLHRRHLTFAYVAGKGILLTPCHRRSSAWLDGETIRRGAYALHGAMLRVGGYTLCVRLFAGLDVPQTAAYQEHWQPASGDDLYAPDDPRMTPVYTPYGAYWPTPVPPGYQESGEAPLFDMTVQPPMPQPQPAPPQPVQSQPEPYAPPAFTEDPGDFLPPDPRAEEPALAEDYFTDQQPTYPQSNPDGTPVRHRRSDRRRSL